MVELNSKPSYWLLCHPLESKTGILFLISLNKCASIHHYFFNIEWKKMFYVKRYKFTWGIKGCPHLLHPVCSVPLKASHPCSGWGHPQPNQLCLPHLYLHYYPKRELMLRVTILKNCTALDHHRKMPALHLLREEQSRRLELYCTWSLYVHKR